MPRRITPVSSPTENQDIPLRTVRVSRSPGIGSPLPGYDEAVNAPTLMETTFITSASDGIPTPLHLREKLRTRFLLRTYLLHYMHSVNFAVIVSCTGMAVILNAPNEAQTAVQGLGVSMFLSFYGVCISHVLDDVAFGSHPKIYRYIHAMVEFTALECWIIITIISFASETFDIHYVTPEMIFLSLLNVGLWSSNFGTSAYKIIKYRNVRETLEDNYPDIRIDASGKLNLSGDAISWLAQPRNKIRLFQAYLCICILSSSYPPDVFTARLHVTITTFALTIILAFCFDAAWRKHFSATARLALDVLLDFSFLGVQLYVDYGMVLPQLSPSLTFYHSCLFVARIYCSIWTLKVGFSTRMFKVSFDKFRPRNMPYAQVRDADNDNVVQDTTEQQQQQQNATQE